MQAIDSALGRVLRYIVVAPRVSLDRDGTISPEPWWAALLRLASGSEDRIGTVRKEK